MGMKLWQVLFHEAKVHVEGLGETWHWGEVHFFHPISTHDRYQHQEGIFLVHISQQYPSHIPHPLHIPSFFLFYWDRLQHTEQSLLSFSETVFIYNMWIKSASNVLENNQYRLLLTQLVYQRSEVLHFVLLNIIMALANSDPCISSDRVRNPFPDSLLELGMLLLRETV